MPIPTHFFAFFCELFYPAHSFCLFLSFWKSLEEFRLFFLFSLLFLVIAYARQASNGFACVPGLTFAVNNWGKFRYFIHLIEMMAVTVTMTRRHTTSIRMLRAGTISADTSHAHADGWNKMEFESAYCDEKNSFRLTKIHYFISRSLVQCVRLYYPCVAGDALKTHIMFRYSAPQKYWHLWLPSIYRRIVVERGVGTTSCGCFATETKAKAKLKEEKEIREERSRLEGTGDLRRSGVSFGLAFWSL